MEGLSPLCLIGAQCVESLDNRWKRKVINTCQDDESDLAMTLLSGFVFNEYLQPDCKSASCTVEVKVQSPGWICHFESSFFFSSVPMIGLKATEDMLR